MLGSRCNFQYLVFSADPGRRRWDVKKSSTVECEKVVNVENCDPSLLAV